MSMAAAFKRAGFNNNPQRLFNLAVDLLRKANRNPHVALQSFVEAIDKDAGLLEAAADFILQAIRADMRGDRLAGGQLIADNPGRPALEPLDGERGHARLDTLNPEAASPSNPNRSGGGRPSVGSQMGIAPAAVIPIRGGEGQVHRDARSCSAVSAAKSGHAKRGAEAMDAVNRIMAKTIMDSLLIDGIPLGEWTIGQALTAGRRKSREGYILVNVARLYANADHSATIRETVKVADVETIIRQSHEVTRD